MRTTLQSMHSTILTNLNKLAADINTINSRISSEYQMQKLSDDPVSLVAALAYRTDLAEIKQYKENIDYGTTIVNTSESTLSEMKSLVERAKILALQQENASLTIDNRINAAQEVKHLFDQAFLLANTQVSNKYIFAGYRTRGYSAAEPTPFLADTIDGYRINSTPPTTMSTRLTSTVTNTTITAGDLAVNGNATAADISTGAVTNGLNMAKAASAKTQIEAADATVSVNLTTLNAGVLATADTADGTDTLITFNLNNIPLGVIIADGANAATVASTMVTAINNATEQTGVEAVVGDTTNGGVASSVVFQNSLAGDDSAIVITDYTTVTGDANPGFGDFNQAADATHNTGQISISSSASITFTSPNNADDAILTELGLNGGGLGFADEAGDGELIIGSRIATGDLTVNGIGVTTSADGISDVYQNFSAAAKAAAINNSPTTTEVAVEVVPASLTASGAVTAGTEDTKLIGTMANNIAINAGDSAINGTDLGAINMAAATNGLGMQRASLAKTAVNGQSHLTGVTANLTTLSAGAATGLGGTSNVTFTVNGVTVTANANANNAAQISIQVQEAINAVSSLTGITAMRGDNTNGGPTDSVVLRNTLDGDETQIVVAGLDANETLRTGLSNVTQAVDATHNTGTIAFSAENPFILSSPNNPNDDLILSEIGLGGGESVTNISGDITDDGTVTYGSTPQHLTSGDLLINGVDIFNSSALVKHHDSGNGLLNAINAKTSLTGVVAGRDSAGRIILTAQDGRNLHLETSAMAEKVMRLHGGAVKPQDKVYFGSLRLNSDLEFLLESNITTVDGHETGLMALGLDGGAASSGETGDTADDGRIFVDTIYKQAGQIRYVADRNNDIAIKVSQKNSLEISKNGQDAVMNTGLFTVLKSFEDYLKGDNYKAVTGSFAAADTTVTLDSGATGLDFEDEITSGSFTITVTNHDTVPPSQFASVGIDINPSEDTLANVAARINGVPGISAYWDANNFLRIESDDPDRYTFAVSSDTSNFLKAAGTNEYDMQVHAIKDSIAELDTLMDDITDQIADFGARSNRISVQRQIYENVELVTHENLSNMQDTDIMESIMQLAAKETAYQAALSAAARVMQISLVDFL